MFKNGIPVSETTLIGMEANNLPRLQVNCPYPGYNLFHLDSISPYILNRSSPDMPGNQRQIFYPVIPAFNRPSHKIIPHDAASDLNDYLMFIFPQYSISLH